MKANPARLDLNRMTRAFFVDRSISSFPMIRARVRSFASTSFESYGNKGEHVSIRLMSNSNLIWPEPIEVSQRSSLPNCGQFEMLIMLFISAIIKNCLGCSSPHPPNGAHEKPALNVSHVAGRPLKQIKISIRPLGRCGLRWKVYPYPPFAIIHPRCNRRGFHDKRDTVASPYKIPHP
jgi:hypothetical protein